jgi:hypothetical protein
LAFFCEHGGYCDCEILTNVADSYFGICDFSQDNHPGVFEAGTRGRR